MDDNITDLTGGVLRGFYEGAPSPLCIRLTCKRGQNEGRVYWAAPDGNGGHNFVVWALPKHQTLEIYNHGAGLDKSGSFA